MYAGGEVAVGRSPKMLREVDISPLIAAYMNYMYTHHSDLSEDVVELHIRRIATVVAKSYRPEELIKSLPQAVRLYESDLYGGYVLKYLKAILNLYVLDVNTKVSISCNVHALSGMSTVSRTTRLYLDRHKSILNYYSYQAALAEYYREFLAGDGIGDDRYQKLLDTFRNIGDEYKDMIQDMMLIKEDLDARKENV
jgi:hypothetical protein